MASPNFDKVWEGAKTLTAEELQRLRTLVDTLLARPGKPLTQADELDLLLLKDGVISEIPPPITDFTPYQGRELIEVRGEPLSETIIKERR